MNRYSWRTFILEIVMILAGIVFFAPFVILLAVAFRNNDAPRHIFDITWPLDFSHIVTAWQVSGMGAAIVNSTIITVLSVIGIIAFAITAAYPLSRYRTKWSRGVFFFFLAGLFLAGQASILPLYTLIRDMHLMGTIWAVVIIHIGANMPFSIFLYLSFLRDIPREYEEAAVIDGCSPVRAFFAIIVPLSRPITGTLVILTALGCWNDFFIPLLYLSASGNKTAPLTLYNFVGQYGADWPLVFSALLLSIIPILVLYFVAQKHIIKGFASGLKG